MQYILALLNNVLLPDFLIAVFQVIAKQLDEKTFCGKAHGTN